MPKVLSKKYNTKEALDSSFSQDSPQSPNIKNAMKGNVRKIQQTASVVNPKLGMGEDYNEESMEYTKVLKEYQMDVEGKDKAVQESFFNIIETCHQKIFEMIKHHDIARSAFHKTMSKNMCGILKQLEIDNSVFKENNEKMAKFISATAKASQQTIAAIEQRILGMKEILTVHNEQWKSSEKTQKFEFDDMVNEEFQTAKERLEKLTNDEKMHQFMETILKMNK